MGTDRTRKVKNNRRNGAKIKRCLRHLFLVRVENMVKIFLTEVNNELNEKVYNFLLSLCAKEKQIQISKKKLKNDRDMSVVGNALSKYALKKEFGINEEFEYSPPGKPYLKSNKAYFSISHSENLVICAVSDKNVGVDVQKIKKVTTKTAEYIGADCENFISLWTKKEAEIKRLGKGIFKENIKGIDTDNTKTFKYKDYYISVSASDIK